MTSIPVPSFIQVQGTTDDLAKSVSDQLHGTEGQAINEDQLERQLTNPDRHGALFRFGIQGQ